MKKTLLGLLTAVLFSSVHAQINEPAFASVKYRFTHVTDTMHRNEPYTETMMLLLGKQSSAYQSYDKILRDSILNKQVEEQLRAGSRNLVIGSPGMKQVSREVIYKDMSTGKISKLENLMGNYLIETPAEQINWTIEPDTRNFNDLVCQKATARFKGRNYTAWFCSQLPYSNGPWKLGGLPGLILEAYDDQKEVVFAFESFEDVSQRQMAIKTPSNTTKATQAEFTQLQAAYKKDPQGFMRTRMAGSGVSVGNISVTGGSISAASVPMSINVTSGSSKKQEMNNPIEKADQ
jgi:GLPGLI family protein